MEANLGLHTLAHAELGMNFFYTFEAIIRILAMGGFLNYIREPWNVFDFSMVTLGYISMLPIGGNASGVRALRALRALRILRTITRFESLRAVVVCFLEVRGRGLDSSCCPVDHATLIGSFMS